MTLFESQPKGALGVLAEFLQSMATSKANEQNPWLKPKGEATWREQLDRPAHARPSMDGQSGTDH